MATIYTIKGTDSISSSRLNINDNFDNLNTELSSIAVFFGITAGNLTLAGIVQAANIIATSAITAGTTLTVTGASTLNGDLITGGKVRYSIASVASDLPTATNFNNSIYQVTISDNTSIVLHNGDEGQEIVVKAIGTSAKNLTLTPDSSNMHGVAGGGIILVTGDDTKDTVVLRYFASKWHIMSISSGATVS